MFTSSRLRPDVILPLRCAECHGTVRVTYHPLSDVTGMTMEVGNIYHCPHCHQQVSLPLPGLLIPPVQARYDS